MKNLNNSLSSKREKKMANPNEAPSISSLPDEITENCLARISKSNYQTISLVCKSFYSILSSLGIYATRSEIGATEPHLYVCLRLNRKHRWFTLGETEGELNLLPSRLSHPPSRLKSNFVAVGSAIYQIGGTFKHKRTRSVFVLHCGSNSWRRVANLTVARKHAMSWFLDGKIYVIGGAANRDKWAEFFDIKTQTWNPMPNPEVYSDDKVVVFGGKLYVFNKDNSNRNRNKRNYAYDPKQGRWVPEEEEEDVYVGSSFTGPCCVVGDLMFADVKGNHHLRWCYPQDRIWFKVSGLDDVYRRRSYNHRSIKLVNHGGKLIIMWLEKNCLDDTKRICCAVVRVEKRWVPPMFHVHGEIERLSVVLPNAPNSYTLSNCLSVLV
ncbi:unnamed protein product [Cochlearia groenlandica]